MSISDIDRDGLDCVFQPAFLPCGRVVQNRLVKVRLSPSFDKTSDLFQRVLCVGGLVRTS